MSLARILSFTAIAMLLVVVACSATDKTAPSMKFENKETPYKTGLSTIWQIGREYMKADRTEPMPKLPLPVRGISAMDLAQAVEPVVYRVSHSTVLMKLDGKLVLTDPVFSERASPVQWMGPKRFHPTAIELETLPFIDVVVISHDHYDHLDKASIKALKDKVALFLVPLELAQYLSQWGVADDKIIELDWWQSHQVDSLTFTATPAQHFSGRGLFDRDTTQWAGWAIRSKSSNIFFSGDSGYFSGFKEIGDRLGPFDLTLIETGAYNELWADIHMLPEQSVQAHLDVRGRAMIPIHNGTFDLALHDWYEPLERAVVAGTKLQARVLTPEFGEPVYPLKSQVTQRWWRELSSRPALQLAKQP